MANLPFITKSQFEAVYDHFREVDEDVDASSNELRIEYGLLLGYFQSVYDDSERKSNKIRHLTAELENCREKSEVTEKEKREDVEELRQKLFEMKVNLDNHRNEEALLVRLIGELRENINNLSIANKATQSKSDTFINRRSAKVDPRGISNLKKNAEHSSKDLQSSRSFKYQKNMKTNQGEKIPVPEEIMKRRYEDEIEKLKNQVKVFSAEAKLFHSEAVSLKKCIESKEKHFSEYKQRLAEEKEVEMHEKESMRAKNSSLEMMIENLGNDLKTLRYEKRLLQGDIKNSKEERHTLLLQDQEKNKYIENLKRNIDSLTKCKQSVDRQVGVFEENLTMDREQLRTAKNDIDLLNKTIEQLRNDLSERESRLNQQETQRKQLEASQKGELLEQLKQIDYYKAQLAMRDKKISSLATDLEKTNEKLVSCRRQLRSKRRENALVSEEFQKWKKNLGINTENMKSLKMKLDMVESSKSVLQSELKFTKSQYFSVLKERDKLLEKCKELNSVIGNREMVNNLLTNRQEYLRNNLKMKDKQMEKVAKLRRLAWAK